MIFTAAYPAAPTIKEALEAAHHILLITHLDPDGDALGSITAMGQAMEQLGKQVILACDGPFIAQLAYLPLTDRLQTAVSPDAPVDLIIAMDCGDDRRMGQVFTNLVGERSPLINIDHHITNNNFGDINLIVGTAVSTTEILYELFQALEITIDQPIATSLLTGLVTDSLGFRTTSVTGPTLRIAGEMVQAGADLAAITRRALSVKPLSTARLWQAGLINFQLDGRIAWATIDNETRCRANHHSSSSNGLANFLSNIEEAGIGVVLIEMDDDFTKVSWRCRPSYNVAVIAKELGGGGHAQAAGCALSGPLAEVEATVIAATRKAIEQQLSAE